MKMNSKIDPYSILGVARDADEAEVRRAFRRKAKNAHPDAGGKREDFERINWAMRLLTDRGQRDYFDRTGTEKSRPPPARAMAMEILSGKLRQIIAQYGDRVTSIDVIGQLRSEVETARLATQRDRAVSERDLARAEKAAARLKGKNGAPSMFLPALNELMRDVRRKIEGIGETERVLAAAEEILDGQSFEVEPAEASPEQGFSRYIMFNAY